MSIASGNNRNSGPGVFILCIRATSNYKEGNVSAFLKIIAGSVVVLNLTSVDRDYLKLFYRNVQSDKA